MAAEFFVSYPAADQAWAEWIADQLERAWLGRQRSWLVVEPLPAYAPDFNPVEPLWSSLKGVELANLDADTVEESPPRPSAASSASGATHWLPLSFLRHCGVSLW